MISTNRQITMALSAAGALGAIIGYLYLIEKTELSASTLFLFMPVGLTSAAIAALLLACHLRSDRQNRQLSDQQKLFSDFIHHAQDLIQVVDTRGNILYVNNIWEETLGYTRAEASRMNIFNIIADDHKSICQSRFAELLNGQYKGCFEVTYQTRDGQAITLEGNCSYSVKNGTPHMIRGIFRDISQRREQDEHILQMAYHDMLTNLPNRFLLNDRLSQAISQARRYHQKAALVYVDLDSFKRINDHHGHTVGDILLQKTARRMQDCLRENDTVSRIGGDEFLLILTGIKDRGDIPQIVDKVRIALAAPYIVNSLRINSSASMGTAIYPLDGVDPEALLNQADQAMYMAKKQGGNAHCFYTENTPPKTKVLRLV
ncbi:sensor domain-containing diguanylate cyclase [Desulfuromonas acetoxidans]|uniref:Diguanylate cyclase with PAS/PAC sensor n=1 Tax=Desulfuromonas acetoxidans (strain DSM 684 / 11070) TaxID=281689 RepID=Q1K1H9_DESA6|nr:sensor domain-containing diguanylate cyclase [Desulfuromonas acetoxidans]EAT16409.1 diguanylate cyclase with PAS/PAC sensor [Desulfuromonas acetoxidans DSM 684]MBF0644353.1 GGDEF domain-containing protein [Desulfuromonas acetoxidans]NVD23548.1 GGDEF domain-containing protein [Desulfuromonas acetoxidans]NVE16067.1 GGDEF domain-containing protein [Desulfuromonas acetoxidans]